jgi:hypothetical protein
MVAALPELGPASAGSDQAGAARLEPAAARITNRVVAVDPWDEYRVGGDLVVEEQPMTATYENTVGAIVIRQLDADGDANDDPLVRFLPH